MITRFQNETAFIVHFDDHLPISGQVDQDNNLNEEGEEGNERDPVVSMLPG
jgi:hypothetical protein